MDNRYYKIAARTGIVFIIICGLILLNGFISGSFSTVEGMREYIGKFGIAAPLILIIIQAFQVVVPVLPGFLGCIAGGVLFGTAGGFICNYIGISTGSVIAFFLARAYGAPLVKSIFPQERYVRLTDKIRDSKSYTHILWWSILLPLAPDDFMCYLSGLIKMPAKKFIMIIVLAKPWCILLYSILSGGNLI